MQMVFQDPYASLDPKMKVEEILMEPLLANKVYTNKKEARKKVKELLEIVGLNETHMKRYPYQFSGGTTSANWDCKGLSIGTGIYCMR